GAHGARRVALRAETGPAGGAAAAVWAGRRGRRALRPRSPPPDCGARRSPGARRGHPPPRLRPPHASAPRGAAARGAGSSHRSGDRAADAAAIPALSRRADLVVLPYLEAEQSGVLATALAFARPVLATAVGGFEEVAALGAAETVPPGDRAALAAAIERLLADPARRARLSSAAAAAAAGPYSWAAAARAHVELYGRLAPMSALATG